MDKSVTTKKFVGKMKVDDRLKRINLKSKRMRNLIKKAIELSQMCDLDISMVVRDREMDKFTLYNSGTQTKGFFTHEEAYLGIQQFSELQKSVKMYTDDHYKILSKIGKNDDED